MVEVFASQTLANTKNPGFPLSLFLPPHTEPVVKHGTEHHWNENPFLSRELKLRPKRLREVSMLRAEGRVFTQKD